MQPTKDTKQKQYYPDVDANPSFFKLEEEVLALWQREGAFQASVDARADAEEFVFYDGPPFANGLPHYGHLLTGFVKDVIPRYQTMKGKKVERRFGWDCHGLPAEMGAEKELKISGRAAITEFGIKNFNEHCRTSVMKYAHEWERYVNRQARWVDFANDYKTMNTPFMESVLWAFKQLYEKGLIYEAYRVMPYSWAAETPLSNFETKLDNSYRDREDKAVTVAFELNTPPKGAPKADKYYVLAWTTTPWTLPSNLALAVGADVKYYYSIHDNVCRIASESWMQKNSYISTVTVDGDSTVEVGANGLPDSIGKVDVNNLIGLSYHPLFPYFTGHKHAFKILDGSSFVTDGDGTGIVHMAPGFGEDDQKVCESNGIEIVCPVDGQGRYTDEIYDLGATPHQDAILTTERLYLRPFAEADYALYKTMQADPKVAATTSDGVLPEERIRVEFNRLLADQKAKGFTQWAVFRKSDDAFLGRAGLDNRDYDKYNTTGKRGVELRYALLSDYWGKGYATELAVALLDWGVEHVKPEIFNAGCNPNYEPAVKLLKKLGFTAHDHVPFREQIVWYHDLDVAHWQEVRKGLVKSLPPLKLKGLNVIAETEGQCADEPYKPEQLKKYGLANLRIINWLKMSDKLIKQEDYKHSYPHCWRTDTPLIYRAMPSWYVEVTKFRDRMVEVNKQINWIPEHIRDGQMHHMLSTAPDWSISRNRFWGTPIPVWRSKSGKVKVFGSIAELEAASGKTITDLHRPMIDEIVITEGGEEYRRVEDVFDCWFESGSMPFAQVHYPFENKEWFEAHFPADFITEYVGQTRGWFNTMITLATALFDKPPFKNCLCHGVVLDAETGLKYSKRLKNYKDPMEVIDTFGADALRWLMISSPVMRGQDLLVDPEGKFIRDVVRLHIKPIWNAYNFFCLYANADGIEAKYSTDSADIMDRYILAKCRDAVEAVDKAMSEYDTVAACAAVSGFFEVLNNWYIRRSKERFWKEEKDADKQAAYNTLYTVLVTMSKASAPLLPFAAEKVYQGLTDEKSVHLADWPGVSLFPRDEELMQQMDFVQSVCNTALAIRNKLNIRVRQPLSSLKIIADLKSLVSLSKGIKDDWALFYEIIKEEINVKGIQTDGDPDDLLRHAVLKLQLNNPVLGKRLPEKMKQIIPASKKGEWKQADGKVEICGEVLQEGEYTLNLEPKPEYKDRAQALSSNDALVILDTNLTPELIAEGIARDVVRAVQEARKNAGLHVSDRITLSLAGGDDVQAAVEKFSDYIAEQTLAAGIEVGVAKGNATSEADVEGGKISIGITKAA